MQMTEELTRQIHAALEATGGSAARAAEFLGMEKRKLYDFIHNNADLKTRWSSSKSEADPGSEEAQSIHRPLLAVRQEAEEVADAVEREDAAVRRGLESIGVRGKALDVGVALQRHMKRRFGSMMEMASGGLVKHVLELTAEVETITTTLNDPASALSPEREVVLREDRGRLLDIIGKYTDKVTNAFHVQQKVIALREAKEGGNRGAKPGFAPLVAVSGNTVTIHEKRD